MNKGINLAVDRRNAKLSTPAKGRLRIFRLGAIALLFGAGLFSVVISILITFSPLPELQTAEEQARSDLSIFRLEINKLAFVNDRGDDVRNIIKKRNVYDKKLAVIKSKMPPGVAFDGLVISKKSYTLRFTGTDLAAFDGLLNSIVGITGKGREFVKATIISIAMDETKNKFVLIVDLLTV